MGGSSGQRARRYAFGIGAVLPAFLFLALGLFLPLIAAVWLSLTRWTGLGPIGDIVGLDNYSRMLRDGDFFRSLLTTAYYAAGTVPLTVGFGLLLAFLIHIRLRGWRLYKLAWFVPVIIPGTVSGILWASAVLAPTTGALDSAFHTMGLSPPERGWLGDSQTAMPAVIAVAVWASTGWPMIILLAAMEKIPQEIRDAARLDGAEGWSLLRYVTLPSIAAVLLAVITLQVIFSLKVFDLVWVMTAGGPGSTTRVLIVLMYNLGFSANQFALAAALAVAFVFVATSAALAQRHMLARGLRQVE